MGDIGDAAIAREPAGEGAEKADHSLAVEGDEIDPRPLLREFAQMIAFPSRPRQRLARLAEILGLLVDLLDRPDAHLAILLHGDTTLDAELASIRHCSESFHR